MRLMISDRCIANEDKSMLKRLLIFSTIALAVAPLAVASDREDDVARTQKAAQVFKEIMDTPDKGIPHHLLESRISGYSYRHIVQRWSEPETLTRFLSGGRACVWFGYSSCERCRSG